MSKEFKLPELGEGVEEGDVLRVIVEVGDSVDADQAVVELETDKATVEVPISFGGVVEKVLIKEGDKVQVGQAILVLGDAAGAVVKAPPPVDAETKETEPQVEDKPALQVVARSETPAPRSPPRIAGTGTTPVVVPAKVESRQVVPAAPSVRRIARELGVDIARVTGSGPGGRISMEDVKEHARQVVSSVEGEGAPPLSSGVAHAPLPDFEKWGQIERQAMSNVRRKTAEHLSQSWTAPHVTNHDRADITELEKLRKRYGKKAESAGGKLTMTAIALKIVASALKVFPQFNASIDMESREIVLKKYLHIGVAVDTERGLLVPVIRDVDQKNIIDLSVELTQAAERARDRKLGLDDMQGGSFTITNLGGIGGTSFTPIVNWPEVAILGISRGRMEPVWLDEQFLPRLMLPLSLSYDHRLIDGADAARFLRWLAEAFENPFLLSLEG
jgi:pyruvate dehydrogenase E2 component (dihydrolipoamide acetyltransferase)